MTQQTPVTEADQAPAARVWRTREVLMSGDERLYAESVATSRARLGELIRNEGYAPNYDSMTETPWFEVVVYADQTVAKIDEDDPMAPVPNARARDWTMVAYHRTDDEGNLTLNPTLLRFEVPEPFLTTGGEIRVRHNLNDEDVTVMAEMLDGTMAAPPMAADLDSHQSEVHIAPGTRRLYVQPAAPDGEAPTG